MVLLLLLLLLLSFIFFWQTAAVMHCDSGEAVTITDALFFVDRLWHQLTLKLTDFVKDPCFKTGDGLIQVNATASHFILYFFNFAPSED